MTIRQEILNSYKKVPLTDKERKVVEYRHGLVDNVQHTLKETGNLYGVTKQRIQQIEKGVLTKIRQYNDFLISKIE